MKKLVSAAASLALAASMVGSAVPFATGAADSSKTLEIRAFEDTAGKAVSTTITADQIAAGDVTIPFGIYLNEATNDCDSITCQWSVNSKDGDASTANVSFVSHEAGTPYYAAKRDVTLSDGSTGSTDNIIGFAGTVIQNERRGDYYSSTGDGQYFAQAGYKSGNIDNAWGSATWITAKDGTGYKWSGDKSDSYPIYVQDAVFKKGTPPGTYTIDFADYVADAEYPDNMSCMIESNGKMTTKNGKLNLKSLTITIEGNGNTNPPATTTSTTKPVNNTTTTTTKPQNPNAKSDFVVTPADVKGKPGETVEVEVYAKAGSHKVGQYVVRLDNADLPQGITASLDDPLCYAVKGNGNYKFELLGETYYCSTLSSGDPTEVNEDEPVMIFTFKIPETAKPGTYDWNLSRFHVVEDGINKIEFDATINPGKITVEGDVTPGTTTTTTKPVNNTTTTTTTKPQNPDAMKDFIVTPADVEVEPGKTVDVEVYAKAGSHKVGQYVVRLDNADLPQGITASLDDPLCYAVKGNGNYKFELLGETYYCSTLSSGDPTEVNEDEPVMIFTFTVPATAKPGTYTWNLSRFHVVEDGINKIEFDATINPGKIVVKGEGTTTTTTEPPKTTTTTTTSEAPKTTTTTTTTSGQPGDVLYGDVNCDKKVNIADVVLLNKWLNDAKSYDMSAQGKINANCCDKDTTGVDSNDSQAIIQSIVHLVDIAKGTCTSAQLQK